MSWELLSGIGSIRAPFFSHLRRPVDCAPPAPQPTGPRGCDPEGIARTYQSAPRIRPYIHGYYKCAACEVGGDEPTCWMCGADLSRDQ